VRSRRLAAAHHDEGGSVAPLASQRPGALSAGDVCLWFGGLAGWGELPLAFLARASLAAKASSKGVVRASMACLLLQPMGWPQ